MVRGYDADMAFLTCQGFGVGEMSPAHQRVRETHGRLQSMKENQKLHGAEETEITIVSGMRIGRRTRESEMKGGINEAR
jgi:hypothetical protein